MKDFFEAVGMVLWIILVLAVLGFAFLGLFAESMGWLTLR